MIEQSRDAYGVALEAHGALMVKLEEIKVRLRGCVDAKELVDAIYALKEVSKLMDECRKEADRVTAQLEHETCKLWVLGDGEPIRTPWCTGSPDVKQTPRVPKKDTPEYAAFCAHYGVAADSMFVPHSDRMLEQISADLKAGKALPPGVNPADMYTVPKVKIHKKRGVLEGAEQETTPF